MMRYFKRCEEFCICGAMGLGNEIIAETASIWQANDLGNKGP